jgi:hypothetical protein
MDPTTGLPFAMRGFADAPKQFTVDMPASVRNNYRMFARDLIVLDGLSWEEQIDEAGRIDEPSRPTTLGVQYYDET